jgi:flavin-dependent dehydrogenase
MSSAGIRVVIVGAGVGGLTLALRLRRRGMTAKVGFATTGPCYGL